jgi:F-type H+-transporting ATPase subunit gamma
MAGLRELKRRIKAVKSTAQVTRAMQLVASSKMKRAQNAAVDNRPYAELLARFFAKLPPETFETISHPLLAVRAPKRRAILVISPDKGLCGGLNTNLTKEILKLPEDATYVAVGKRAAQTLARLGRKVIATFSLSDRARWHELRPAAKLLLEAYEKAEIDSVEVLYTAFINTVSQTPLLETLLPMTQLDKLIASFQKRYTSSRPLFGDDRPFIIEPDANAILSELLPLYLRSELYHCALEAKASEHSARMIAMKNATDNAQSLTNELTLKFNKARQSAITNEIIEIAAASAGGEK